MFMLTQCSFQSFAHCALNHSGQLASYNMRLSRDYMIHCAVLQLHKHKTMILRFSENLAVWFVFDQFGPLWRPGGDATLPGFSS